MRAVLFAVTIAVGVPCCARPQQIDFVGCPADGQTGPLDAPHGVQKTVSLDEVSAKDIAYYKGAESPGVFAPRGWNCQVWYGSSGNTLIVTPARIDPNHFPPPRFHDEAVEMSFLNGGTSRRFDVASIASQLFPVRAARFIEAVKREGFGPASNFGNSKATDVVKPLNDVMSEFTTPANTSGLGTDGYLDPSQDSISGIALLDESDKESPSLAIVRVRLRSDKDNLKAALSQLHKLCLLSKAGC